MEQLSSHLLRQLEQLRFEAKKSALSGRAGGHRSLRRGHGVEFSDYREYQPGDNPRHIDWALFSRSDRLYIKEYHEDRELTVAPLVDLSSSMTADKREVASKVAFAFGYIALLSGDGVSVVSSGRPPSPVTRGSRGVTTLRRLVADGAKAPESSEPFLLGASRALATLMFPAQLVVVSDLLVPIAEFDGFLRNVRARGLDAVVVRIAAPLDRDPFPDDGQFIARSAETGEGEEVISVDGEVRTLYRQRYLEHEIAVRRAAERRGFRLVTLDVSQPFESEIMRVLPLSGVIR